MVISSGNSAKEVSVSFEVFPPKEPKSADSFWRAIDDLEHLNPTFLSITYGAGGSTRDRSLEIVKRVLSKTGLTPVAHITCVGASKDEADDMVHRFYEAGVRRFVALRGDAPAGDNQFLVHPDGYAHATEFVTGIKEQHPDVDIAVAGYPEKHPESPSVEFDLDVLKQKVDAGATRCITQFFFDVDVYFRFVDNARAAGIDIPIVPGILPILNFTRVQQFAKSCGASIPKWLQELFEGTEASSPVTNMLAASVAIEQCATLYEQGVRDFHFYTLNKAELTHAICHSLGVRSTKNTTTMATSEAS